MRRAQTRTWRPGGRREESGEKTYSPILETGSRAVFHTILIFSLFTFFSGHNQPGGGFVAGLIAGGAFVVRYLALGAAEFQKLVRPRPETVMGAGLLVAAGSGIASLLYGEVFDYAFAAVRVPAIGEIAFSTSLVFDAGVYLVVVGMVTAVIGSLGAGAES